MNVIYWSRPFWLEVTEPKSTQLEGKEVLVSLLNQECIDQPNDRKTSYTWALGNQRLLNVIGICTFLFLSLFLCAGSVVVVPFYCCFVCVCFVCFWFIIIIIIFGLASGLWDLSSPTRDQT